MNCNSVRHVLYVTHPEMILRELGNLTAKHREATSERDLGCLAPVPHIDVRFDVGAAMYRISIWSCTCVNHRGGAGS